MKTYHSILYRTDCGPEKLLEITDKFRVNKTENKSWYKSAYGGSHNFQRGLLGVTSLECSSRIHCTCRCGLTQMSTLWKVNSVDCISANPCFAGESFAAPSQTKSKSPPKTWEHHIHQVCLIVSFFFQINK